MSHTSGLRKIAAIFSITSLLSLAIGAPASAANPYGSTVTFLSNAMVKGKALDGYPAGTPEYGFTLEAMMQLKAGGKTFVQQLPAITYMLSTKTQPLGSSSKGYLFNKDTTKSLKVGRAGKFLFTSEAINVPNNAIRFEVFKKLSARINNKTGEISGTEAGVIDYAWVALGLNSYQEYTLANRVVQKMLTLQNADGGFGEADLVTSTPDATGLALQAINYRETFGSDSEDNKRLASEKKATAYLLATDVEDSYWSAYGGPSVNSTAYALMGLKAAGKKSSSLAKHVAWLKSKLASTGGFITDWSNGSGDVFATSQAYVPLIGKSYLDLLP